MPRLPIITEDMLTDEQRRVWNIVTQGRRGSTAELTDVHGGLVGPFNAMVTSPTCGGNLAALGEALRFDTSLDRSVVELATIVVGAHWRSNFEWAVHSRLARLAGIDDGVIDAIAHGRRPTTEPPLGDVYDAVTQLLTDGRIDPATYGRLSPQLGEAGLVELVTLVGYYCIICFSLNTFEVELPVGEPPQWADGSQREVGTHSTSE